MFDWAIRWSLRNRLTVVLLYLILAGASIVAALNMAVDVLEGKTVEKTITLSPAPVTSENIKLCEEGTWEEMKAGCNTFSPEIITNPGWFASIFSEKTPEVGLNAALVGQPED